MIISHEHKYIFIKTNKTAGSSIEICLSASCGDNDILTECLPEEERLKKELGYRCAQNNRIPLEKYTLRNWLSLIRKRKLKNFPTHTRASEIKRIFGDDIWKNYYKFCFERNPWDRVVSLYYFMLKRNNMLDNPAITISEFINSRKIMSLKKWGYEAYAINNRIVVDRVCKYENLQNELHDVCVNQLGLSSMPQLPYAKSNIRMDKRHYREILSDYDRQRIATIFSKEIDLFGYEF